MRKVGGEGEQLTPDPLGPVGTTTPTPEGRPTAPLGVVPKSTAFRRRFRSRGMSAAIKVNLIYDPQGAATEESLEIPIDFVVEE